MNVLVVAILLRLTFEDEKETFSREDNLRERLNVERRPGGDLCQKIGKRSLRLLVEGSEPDCLQFGLVDPVIW